MVNYVGALLDNNALHYLSSFGDLKHVEAKAKSVDLTFYYKYAKQQLQTYLNTILSENNNEDNKRNAFFFFKHFKK